MTTRDQRRKPDKRRLTARQPTHYERYLVSPAWRRRRAAFAQHHPKICLCSSRERIQLHHRTYERLGRELDTDLMWLCERCHALVEQLVDEGRLDRTCIGFSDIRRAVLYRIEQEKRQRQAHEDFRTTTVIKPWDNASLAAKQARKPAKRGGYRLKP